MVETEGSQMTSQYGAYDLHVGLARLHAHAHTLGHTRARTHTKICNIYCFSTATIIPESASMLYYTYIDPLVSLRGRLFAGWFL